MFRQASTANCGEHLFPCSFPVRAHADLSFLISEYGLILEEGGEKISACPSTLRACCTEYSREHRDKACRVAEPNRV
jgi:hypothetical protein